MCTDAGAEEPETADREERVRREVISATQQEVPSALKTVIDNTVRQGVLAIAISASAPHLVMTAPYHVMSFFNLKKFMSSLEYRQVPGDHGTPDPVTL